MEGKWLNITDYCQYRKKSISTIRRYIKSNAIKFKIENGKYLLWVPGDSLQKQGLREEQEILKLKLMNSELERQNKILKTEINDLKMLVSIYEGISNEQKSI